MPSRVYKINAYLPVTTELLEERFDLDGILWAGVPVSPAVKRHLRSRGWTAFGYLIARRGRTDDHRNELNRHDRTNEANRREDCECCGR